MKNYLFFVTLRISKWRAKSCFHCQVEKILDCSLLCALIEYSAANKVLQVLNDGVTEDFVLKAQQRKWKSCPSHLLVTLKYFTVLALDTLNELKKKVLLLEEDEWMFTKPEL
jgi:hypothetical protein